MDEGDEVVVLEPYYDSYVAMIQMAGGVRRPVTLRAPDFRLDVDELAGGGRPRGPASSCSTARTTRPGRCWTASELQAVADVAIEHDLVVITDEVYEHLVFDDHEHVPLATLPGMFERTLTLSSAGKSYSFTGWKVGWATGPAELVDAVLAAKQWLTFTSGAPLQPAIAHALDDEPDFPLELAADLQKRRDLLCSGLAEVGLDVRVPEGTYFALTDVSDLGWDDGLAFCLALPERAGVVAIPTQGFHDTDAGRHLVRWAFCKERVRDRGRPAPAGGRAAARLVPGRVSTASSPEWPGGLPSLALEPLVGAADEQQHDDSDRREQGDRGDEAADGEQAEQRRHRR